MKISPVPQKKDEISTPHDVKNYYQQQEVAENYIEKRFTEPLNIIEHQRHVALLNEIIAKFHCQKILEFAPGPARVTAELAAAGGTSIDSSGSMLALAQQRMQHAGKKWNFVEGDILNLNLNLKQRYDLVFCIRFLLHFQELEREKIYQQAALALRPGGYLVFEAMNKKVVLPLRRLLGKRRYVIYDKLYQKEELREELEKNGFRVVKLSPLLNHFWSQAFFSRPLKILGLKKTAQRWINFLEQFPSENPYEWLVLCQKK